MYNLFKGQYVLATLLIALGIFCVGMSIFELIFMPYFDAEGVFILLFGCLLGALFIRLSLTLFTPYKEIKKLDATTLERYESDFNRSTKLCDNVYLGLQYCFVTSASLKVALYSDITNLRLYKRHSRRTVRFELEITTPNEKMEAVLERGTSNKEKAVEYAKIIQSRTQAPLKIEVYD